MSDKPKQHHKFLMRKLTVGAHQEEVLSRFTQRRFFIKQVQQDSYQSSQSARKYLKQPKQFKTLFHITLQDFAEPYWLSIIKQAKHLKSFKQPFVYAKDRYLLKYLQRLPPQVQKSMLRLSKPAEWTEKHLKPIYREVSALKELKSFKRFFLSGVASDSNNIEQELRIINRIFPRFRKIEELQFELTYYDQLGFQNAMRKNIGSPFITDFTQILTYLQAGERGTPESSDDDEEGYTEDYQIQAFENNPSEITNFFKYHLFQNLQILTVIATEDIDQKLNPSIIQSFQHLTRLRSLTIELHTKPQGSIYLFQGLLLLPLLEEFKLEVDFLKTREWTLLREFLQKQKDLVSLSFTIIRKRSCKETFGKQAKSLENVAHFLNNKPNLRYLRLKLGGDCIDRISEVLENVHSTETLKYFEIEAFANPTIVHQPNHMKGLFNFIKKQKDTLTFLQIDFIFLMDLNILSYFAEACTSLNVLKELKLNVNHHGLRQDLFAYVSDIYEGKEFQECDLSLPLSFPKILRRLRKLESLQIEMWILYQEDEKFLLEFLDSLVFLKDLKTVALVIEPQKELNIEWSEQLGERLAKLKHILRFESFPNVGGIKSIIDKFNSEQAKFRNLSF